MRAARAAARRGQRGGGHEAARNGTESTGNSPSGPSRQGPKVRRLLTRVPSTLAMATLLFAMETPLPTPESNGQCRVGLAPREGLRGS
jgi:hypothetical protein